jgi:hypothetical protein
MKISRGSVSYFGSPWSVLARCARDWWRGYTDGDIWNAQVKVHNARGPGAVIPLTSAEFKAYVIRGERSVYLRFDDDAPSA